MGFLSPAKLGPHCSSFVETLDKSVNHAEAIDEAGKGIMIVL